jgi:predicted RNase H-like HicB family nuclease
MISKDSIRRTAVCRWSDEDECFVVESPLFDRVIGTGYTAQEAQALFESMLDGAYAEIKAGNVIGYNKAGRPAKEGVQLNCRVKQHTHEGVAQLAKDLDISQGEVVDVLAFHYLNKPAASNDIAAVMRQVLDERGIGVTEISAARRKSATGRQSRPVGPSKKTAAKKRAAR